MACRPTSAAQTSCVNGLSEAVSQLYLSGRGDRSYFDCAAMYFYGFSEADLQSQIPVIHPVMDYSYVFGQPIFGGELSYQTNFTSLSRVNADFDPITQTAFNNSTCTLTTADPAQDRRQLLAARLPRDLQPRLRRGDLAAQHHRSLRPDLDAVRQAAGRRRGGLDRSISPASPTSCRPATAPCSAPCRRSAWNTAIRSSACSPGARRRSSRSRRSSCVPNETSIGKLPNEDSQSLIFDDSNLFKLDKFSGWDRIEGGGRANVGFQYTAQFNRGGSVNALFGQSYQLFGTNSFAVGDNTNTGLGSGLDTTRSDYVARLSYQPDRIYSFTTRFRFDEDDYGSPHVRDRRPRPISTAGRFPRSTANTTPSRNSAS